MAEKKSSESEKAESKKIPEKLPEQPQGVLTQSYIIPTYPISYYIPSYQYQPIYTTYVPIIYPQQPLSQQEQISYAPQILASPKEQTQQIPQQAAPPQGLQQQAIPPQVVSSQAIPPQIVASQTIPQQVLYAPLQQPYQEIPQQTQIPVQQLEGKQIVGEPIKGQSRIEYIPYERVVTEYEERIIKEKIPVQKKITDYYAVEHQIEYIPEVTYNTYTEYVPQEKTIQTTQYIAQQKSYIKPEPVRSEVKSVTESQVLPLPVETKPPQIPGAEASKIEQQVASQPMFYSIPQYGYPPFPAQYYSGYYPFTGQPISQSIVPEQMKIEPKTVSEPQKEEQQQK